ncbi:hypothetical protein PH562_16505 [Rhizobium sp. CNPSo 4062]|uniref:hypothetical protein n=1 Tax=Rhizobium sp. CNPSo 4062 TaxID=3021410 RepID=UPI0025506BBC|nr:hypothetical protein [Rhizobium sp. CNPSo 4062]MDK4703854.1 hypothetical protein [Rhizobium sp. CNPSo 4062]
MSKIPDDIMERARTLYSGLWANDSRENLSDHDKREDVLSIAMALSAERLRIAEIMEETATFVRAFLTNYAETQDGDGNEAPELRAARALLSKLGDHQS